MCSGTWACGDHFFRRIWRSVILKLAQNRPEMPVRQKVLASLKRPELGLASVQRRAEGLLGYTDQYDTIRRVEGN